MPFFEIKGKSLNLVKSLNFNIEKELQSLIEQNLETVFNCQFIASEFSTGIDHAGRIDTLALSEDNNPVIIEYKKVESSELINQALYYLSWIYDHRGDFQMIVNKVLGHATIVDWSDVRVICLAPGYKKYDLHAVKVMGANIELWQYRLLENGHLHIDEIFRKSDYGLSESMEGKNPVYVAAGKKGALTRATGEYTYNKYLEGVESSIKKIVDEIREFSLCLDESVIEVPKKYYIAYKAAQNFVCVQPSKNKVILYLKLKPKEIGILPVNGRDVTDIGHYGTGNFELIVKNTSDLVSAKQYIEQAYRNVGG